MRLQDRPRFRAGGAIRFADFFTAARAVKAIAQAGLYPANCRILDPQEAVNTGAGDGSAAIMVLAFESADHPLDAWIARALECCADHGGTAERPGERDAHREGAAELWRTAFIRMPYARERMIRRGDHRRHLRNRDHLGAVRGLPRPGQGRRRNRDPRGHRSAGPGNLPLHPCLSRRSGAVFLVSCAGPPRRSRGAMADDQERGRRCADRGRRHHHPSPRGRPRSPPVVRSAASRAVRRRAAGGQTGARSAGPAQSRRADRSMKLCQRDRTLNWQAQRRLDAGIGRGGTFDRPGEFHHDAGANRPERAFCCRVLPKDRSTMAGIWPSFNETVAGISLLLMFCSDSPTSGVVAIKTDCHRRG